MSEQQIARGLGWFSIGLGLVEMLAPRPLAKFLGSRHPGLIRLFGMREFTAGVGILVLNKPTAPWLWARVGGNVLDVAALALTYQNSTSTRKVVSFSMANVIAITALDVWCAQRQKPYNWPIDPPAQGAMAMDRPLKAE